MSTADPAHEAFPGPGRSDDVVYSERLWPSPAVWLAAPGLGLGVGLSMVPLGLPFAVAAGVAVAVAVAVALVLTSPQVEVTTSVLRAGRARVPRDVLGAVSWFDGEDARLERGPRLDARAYLCIRGWIRPVVRVELDDPADPTPYWLVSSRRPAELAGALSPGS